MGEYFDNDAMKRQRRNLVITSVWMALFLFGGIGFNESSPSTISPLMSFTIKDTRIVEWAMWGVFVYFWWRYFMYYRSRGHEYSESVIFSMIDDKRTSAIAATATRKAGATEEDIKDKKVATIRKGFFRRDAQITGLNVHGGVDAYMSVTLPYWRILWIEIKHQVVIALTDARFSEYALPHMMAVSVSCLGVWTYMK